MPIKLQTNGRLDYGAASGINAHLEVRGTQVLIRLDVPTWEWVEATAPLREILGELLRYEIQQHTETTNDEIMPLFQNK